MDFNYLDIAIAIPLAIGVVQGFKRGVIHEVLMLVGLVIAIYFAYVFSDTAGEWLMSITDKTGAMLPILSFIMIFLIVLLAFLLLSKLLSAILNVSGLGFFNKLFGGVFGGLKFALILSIILVFFLPIDEKTGLLPKKTKKESMLFTPLVNIGLMLQPQLYYLKDRIKEELQKIEEYEDEMVV